MDKLEKTDKEESEDKAFDREEDKYFTEKQIEDEGSSYFFTTPPPKKNYSARELKQINEARNIERDSAILAHQAFSEYVFGRISLLEMKKANDQWLEARKALAYLERRNG